MTDLLTEVGKLETSIKERERKAIEYEGLARQERALRAEEKTRLAELNTAINNAVNQKAIQDSAKAAESARQHAEAAKTESLTVLDRLTSKEAELDAKSKRLDDLLAKAATTPE